MVLSGLIWGVLAYLTSSIYVIIAIVIGVAVTFAITIPFKRVPLLLALVMVLPTIRNHFAKTTRRNSPHSVRPTPSTVSPETVSRSWRLRDTAVDHVRIYEGCLGS